MSAGHIYTVVLNIILVQFLCDWNVCYVNEIDVINN